MGWACDLWAEMYFGQELDTMKWVLTIPESVKRSLQAPTCTPQDPLPEVLRSHKEIKHSLSLRAMPP